MTEVRLTSAAVHIMNMHNNREKKRVMIMLMMKSKEDRPGYNMHGCLVGNECDGGLWTYTRRRRNL